MSATASGASQVEETHAAGLRIFGQQITVGYRAVDDELARRGALGLGAVVDQEVLGALFELPVDLPVRRACVSARHQRLLRRAPAGVVDRNRREVTRLLVPAIRVAHVNAHGRASVRRLRRLSEFGPFTARTMVLSGPTPSAVEFAEASRLGIGMVHADGSVLLAGAPFVVRRHTAASWLFAEATLAELLELGALCR